MELIKKDKEKITNYIASGNVEIANEEFYDLAHNFDKIQKKVFDTVKFDTVRNNYAFLDVLKSADKIEKEISLTLLVELKEDNKPVLSKNNPKWVSFCEDRGKIFDNFSEALNEFVHKIISEKV